MTEKDAKQFVTLARNLTASGDYAKAFEEYLQILKNFPTLHQRLLDEFRSCMYRANQRLSHRYRVREIFDNFNKALAVLPTSVPLLDDIGSYLCRHGCYSHAISYYESAYKIDRTSACVDRHLNDVKKQLFDARLFRSLNDKSKNEAYLKAVRKVVRPLQDITMILNPGPGLLGLLVHSVEPASCVVVEQSAAYGQIATQLLKGNQKSGSGPEYTRVVLSETTFVITDDFDEGLFGRGVLDNLSNAWDILKKTRGVVVPARAEFYIIGAQCDSLHKKYKLTEDAKDTLDMPGWILQSCLIARGAYVSEDVNTYQDMKFLTDAGRLFKVDLNSYDDVKYFVNRYEPTYASLKAIKEGTINCLVGFFKLYLTDDVIITTDPRSGDKCSAWQQAVFINEYTQDVIRNQEVAFKFAIHWGLVSLQLSYYGQGTASPDLLRFLNDQEYMKAISDSVSAATIYLGQTSDLSELDILDLCPYPWFGFLMLKRGINSLTCRLNRCLDRHLFERALDIYGIPLSKVSFMCDNCTWDTFKGEKFHAIFEHPFKSNGDVNFLLNRLSAYWSRVNLHEDGLVLPSTISVMGVLADCPRLDIDNILDDANICGYKLAKKLNRYSLNMRKGLSISNIEYTPLSQPFVVADNLRDMSSGAIEAEVETKGSAHSVITYFKITVMGDLQATSSKTSNFMDNMMYSSKKPAPVLRGDQVKLLRHVDKDGTFKICFDNDDESNNTPN